MQSKRRGPHPKWPHRETNVNISLSRNNTFESVIYHEDWPNQSPVLQDWRLCLRVQLNLAKNCDRFKTPAQVLQNWRLCFWLWFDLMKHRDTSVTHVLVLHNSRLCLWLQLDPGKKNRSPIYKKLHLFSCTGVCDSERAKPLPAILKRRKRRHSLENVSKR